MQQRIESGKSSVPRKPAINDRKFPRVHNSEGALDDQDSDHQGHHLPLAWGANVTAPTQEVPRSDQPRADSKDDEDGAFERENEMPGSDYTTGDSQKARYQQDAEGEGERRVDEGARALGAPCGSPPQTVP
jgi:hypothetical protein